MHEKLRVVHVIVTRFNCRFADRDFPARRQQGWLESRFELFERYCLPTLKAQTDKNFDWAVYFDTETPLQFIARARRLFDGFPRFHIRFLDVYTGDNLIADLKCLLGQEHDWLLSTRLDNDDGLSEAFIAELQRSFRPGQREALNFPEGLLLGNDRIYRSRQASNAFISVSEPFEGFGTALQAQHKEMSKTMPVRDLAAGPMWLQVIHGGNVSNKLRGRRVAYRDMPAGFGALPNLVSGTSGESRLSIMAENYTLSLLWALRDRAISILRKTRTYARSLARGKHS